MEKYYIDTEIGFYNTHMLINMYTHISPFSTSLCAHVHVCVRVRAAVIVLTLDRWDMSELLGAKEKP